MRLCVRCAFTLWMSVGHGPCFLQIIYLVHGSWLKWCTEEASGSRSRRKNLSAFQLYLSLSKPPVPLKCSVGGQFGGHWGISFKDYLTLQFIFYR